MMLVPGDSPFRKRALWTTAALISFALAVVSTYCGVWREGASSVVPVTGISARGDELESMRRVSAEADATFATWLVARNAYTLSHRPHRLFDAEHCAPAEKSLALGEPMITMGILGIPATLLTGDPVATYNAVLVALSLIAALAMYLLVAEWTAVPLAGIAAGLIYAFHPLHLRDVTHPFIYDTAWTVLALLFARRLFAHGRWRDAVGLAGSCALQLGASFYPVLAATFLTPPYALWLLYRYRLRNLHVGQLAFVAVFVILAAAFVYGPYLGIQGSDGSFGRPVQHFAGLRSYLPGKIHFPGWTCLALVAASLLLGRQRAAAGLRGDPRWALLAGAALVAIAAAGPGQAPAGAAVETGDRPGPWIPDLYAMLSSVLPGLGSVRGVIRLSSGVQLVLSVLAGMGTAAILRIGKGRVRQILAVALLLVIGLDTLRPTALGFEPRLRHRLVPISPDPNAIEFFQELQRLGNSGPILELPMAERRSYVRLSVDPPRILLSAHHRRRTSSCYGSFSPPGWAELEETVARLPDREALLELGKLGFTTIIVHHPGPFLGIRARLEQEAHRPSGLLRSLHATPSMTAYAIES